MILSERIDKIVHKIIKNKYIHYQIMDLILRDKKNKYVKNTILSIYKLIYEKNNFRNFHFVKKDRTFISNKLSQYISLYFSHTTHNWNRNELPIKIKPNAYCQPQLKIADIGGGDGEIIKEIGQNLNIPKNNLFCVEQNIPWSEPYRFIHSDKIKYIFWDNNKICEIEPDSIDVTIMMVTLHHMTDETIHKTFENLQKIMKQNSLFIIKEHDCQSQEDRFVIDWEHHLYHLIESPMILDGDIDQYLREYISNFKSKYNFDLLLKQYDFSPIQELNRFFESEKDHKNATNLYWKIYMKM